MDLLCQLAPIKGKSKAYIFNNMKIKKILNMERNKESIMMTVRRLREKLIRWRLFTKTTLVNVPKKTKDVAVPIPVQYDESEHRLVQTDSSSQKQGDDFRKG